MLARGSCDAVLEPVVVLQILHRPGLIDPKASVLLTPAVTALLGELRVFACQRQALALGRLHLNRAELQNHLLRSCLLSSPHVRLVRSWLILSISLVQSHPARSAVLVHSLRSRHRARRSRIKMASVEDFIIPSTQPEKTSVAQSQSSAVSMEREARTGRGDRICSHHHLGWRWVSEMCQRRG